MPDREKYIEVLSKTAKAVKELNEDAPIKISLECIEDILELLKEQEAAAPIPYHRSDGTIFRYECGKCRTKIFKNDLFCRHCGQAVKWE